MTRVLGIALAIVLAACTSPEASRTLGGGRGADKGNRGDEVRMHEGSRPYYATPQLSPAAGPPVEPAQHAYGLSRR